jgi:hypothetical protein
MRRDETRRATRRALEAVRIRSDLIADYPHEIRWPQPYVILLEPASGILKHLDLQTAKYYLFWPSVLPAALPRAVPQ